MKKYVLNIHIPEVFDGGLQQWNEVFFTVSIDDVGRSVSSILSFCFDMGWDCELSYCMVY